MQHAETNNNKPKTGLKLTTVLVLILAFAIGFVSNLYVSKSERRFTSSVKPVGNIFEVIAKTPEVKETEELIYNLETGDKGNFNISENNEVIVKSNKGFVMIPFGELSVSDFQIDFDNHTSSVVIDGNEYKMVVSESENETAKIPVCEWKDESGEIAKVYSAIPLNETEEILIYSEANGKSSDDISKITENIKSFIDNLEVSDKCTITVNGKSLNIDNISYITKSSITLNDGSFMATVPYSDNQKSKVVKIYTEKVFEDWQTNKGLSADKQGRKAYVKIEDGVKYIIRATDETIDNAKATFSLNTVGSAESVNEEA